MSGTKVPGGKTFVEPTATGNFKERRVAFREWHAKAKDPRDSWHKGRFLEHWAEQEVMQALPDTFAKYGLEDVQRALKANLDFYDKFGREVASAFGYDFREEAYSFAVEQLQELVS